MSMPYLLWLAWFNIKCSRRHYAQPPM